METEYLTGLVDRLRLWGHTIASGLSDQELPDIEARFGFCFPPDLRQFLQHCLPTSRGWVDWRNAPEANIRERLSWPLDGMIFDIEHNVFWLDAWGPKPSTLSESVERARIEVAQAPILIPIFSHRYIPAEPLLTGNPVYSVHQTDIIHYGYDLASYFENEFSVGPDSDHVSGDFQPDIFQKTPRPIRFWDEIMFWERGHIG